jgi:hypothetical protein
MPTFLKLSNRLININYIHQIILNPSKLILNHTFLPRQYTIIMNKDISGFIFIGIGSMSSIDNYIHICETNNPIDFQTITDWINERLD